MPLARKASFGWSKCAAAPADRLTGPSVHCTGSALQMIPTEFRKRRLRVVMAGWPMAANATQSVDGLPKPSNIRPSR